jgi:hypothetical protein
VDVLASLALILGLKISVRKDDSFLLGLYKVENENMASIAISFSCEVQLLLVKNRDAVFGRGNMNLADSAKANHVLKKGFGNGGLPQRLAIFCPFS